MTIKKNKSRNKIESDLYYVVMHTNNLAICMASGFIGPRFENGAVRDHNYRSDTLIINSLPIPENYFIEAFGDLKYGAVCIVSVKIPKIFIGTKILPFSYVESVIFSSQLDSDEFSAKLSGYSDIPDFKLPLRVDQTVFPVALDDTLKINVTLHEYLNPDQGYYFSVDKLSGLIFTLFFSINKLKKPAIIKKLIKLSELNSTILGPNDFFKKITQILDLFTDLEEGFFLLDKLFNFLNSAEAKNGFNPKLFLNQLKTVSYQASTESQRRIIDGFCKHSLDILELRRDLTSLGDEDGKVIPRAILLFMLSPDSNKLDGLSSMYPNLGNNVYLVASMLIGFFAGASTLPSNIKSFSNDSALIVPDFVFDLTIGGVGLFQFESSFDETGSSANRLTYKDKKLIDFRLNPDERLTNISNALRAAGQKVGFGSDGLMFAEVANDSCKVTIIFELINSFWSPLDHAIKASAVIPLKVFNKTVGEILTCESNPTNKGVLLTIKPLGKSYGIELSMYSYINNFSKIQAAHTCKEIFNKFEDIIKKLN
jgi:hypothetical protein